MCTVHLLRNTLLMSTQSVRNYQMCYTFQWIVGQEYSQHISTSAVWKGSRENFGGQIAAGSQSNGFGETNACERNTNVWSNQSISLQRVTSFECAPFVNECHKSVQRGKKCRQHGGHHEVECLRMIYCRRFVGTVLQSISARVRESPLTGRIYSRHETSEAVFVPWLTLEAAVREEEQELFLRLLRIIRAYLTFFVARCHSIKIVV